MEINEKVHKPYNVHITQCGGYKIVDVNAELAPYRENLRVGLYDSTYNKGNKR